MTRLTTGKDPQRDIASIALRTLIQETPPGPSASALAAVLPSKLLQGISSQVTPLALPWCSPRPVSVPVLERLFFSVLCLDGGGLAFKTPQTGRCNILAKYDLAIPPHLTHPPLSPLEIGAPCFCWCMAGLFPRGEGRVLGRAPGRSPAVRHPGCGRAGAPAGSPPGAALLPKAGAAQEGITVLGYATITQCFSQADPGAPLFTGSKKALMKKMEQSSHL